MPLSIDHIVIAVADLDAAIRDYTALGFTVLPGGERHALLRQAVERFLPSPLELRLHLHAQITPRPLGQAVLGLGAALGRERRSGQLSLRIH